MLGLGDHATEPPEFSLKPAVALTAAQRTSLPAAAAVGAVASIRRVEQVRLARTKAKPPGRRADRRERRCGDHERRYHDPQSMATERQPDACIPAQMRPACDGIPERPLEVNELCCSPSVVRQRVSRGLRSVRSELEGAQFRRHRNETAKQAQARFATFLAAHHLTTRGLVPGDHAAMPAGRLDHRKATPAHTCRRRLAAQSERLRRQTLLLQRPLVRELGRRQHHRLRSPDSKGLHVLLRELGRHQRPAVCAYTGELHRAPAGHDHKQLLRMEYPEAGQQRRRGQPHSSGRSPRAARHLHMSEAIPGAGAPKNETVRGVYQGTISYMQNVGQNGANGGNMPGHDGSIVVGRFNFKLPTTH